MLPGEAWQSQRLPHIIGAKRAVTKMACEHHKDVVLLCEIDVSRFRCNAMCAKSIFSRVCDWPTFDSFETK